MRALSFRPYTPSERTNTFVDYGAGLAAGVRAVEHLTQVAIEAELAPLRNSVLPARVLGAFEQSGSPHDPMADASLGILLDDLAWWATLLRTARADQLPPAAYRMRATATA